MSALQSSSEVPCLLPITADLTIPKRPKRPHPNKGKKVPPEILTEEEVFRLFEVLHANTSPRGVMLTALVTIFLRSLLRKSEAVALYPKDLDLKAFSIRVLHGKGDRCRVVGLDPKACVYVQSWLNVREELGLTDNHPVFVCLKQPYFGKRLSDWFLVDFFTMYRRKAEIRGRFYPHGLRHTGAVHMLRDGASLQVIQKQLGHTSLARTAIYLDHLHPATVVNWCANRPWNDQNWNAREAGSQKYVVIRESTSTTGFIVTFKASDNESPDKYLRFPNEIVPALEDSTFFAERSGAFAAIESLLPSIDFRSFHPVVQAVAKCGERSTK